MRPPTLGEPELPKGMLPPAPESTANEKAPDIPAPLSLAQGNYAGAILQALELTLPFEVVVDRCAVIERIGHRAHVSLRLTIGSEKTATNGIRKATGDRPLD